MSKAQGGHEHSTSVLLRRNADVTAVDDSGRTAVDLTQNRWIQTALRQAWNDATCCKFVAENVAPSHRPPAAVEALPMSSPRFVSESLERPRYSPANTPRVRSGKPLKTSRSLDQADYRDATRSPSTSVSINCNHAAYFDDHFPHFHLIMSAYWLELSDENAIQISQLWQRDRAKRDTFSINVQHYSQNTKMHIWAILSDHQEQYKCFI